MTDPKLPPTLIAPNTLSIGITKPGSSLPRFVSYPFLPGITILPDPGDYILLPDSAEQWYEVEHRNINYLSGVVEIRVVELPV